jgi:hypothetical protein
MATVNDSHRVRVQLRISRSLAWADYIEKHLLYMRRMIAVENGVVIGLESFPLGGK